MNRRLLAAIGLLFATLAGGAACRADDRDSDSGRAVILPSMMPPKQTNADAQPPAIPFDSATPRVVARAVGGWPHDTGAFTQGLVIDGGRLLESVGREGHSDVREVDRVTGRVLRHTALPDTEFGEGIAVVGQRLYQVTWRGGRGHVYDARSLAPVDSFVYEGEGWGLATDGRLLYLSDGTSRIRVVDPLGFRVQSTIRVREADKPVWMLNELEWVRGELWANVYLTNFIARIDPSTGRIVGWVDVGSLLAPAERTDVEQRGGVANGIAFDSTANRLLVTGKLWPKLFQIDVGPMFARTGAHSAKTPP